MEYEAEEQFGGRSRPEKERLLVAEPRHGALVGVKNVVIMCEVERKLNFHEVKESCAGCLRLAAAFKV